MGYQVQRKKKKFQSGIRNKMDEDITWINTDDKYHKKRNVDVQMCNINSMMQQTRNQ